MGQNKDRAAGGPFTVKLNQNVPGEPPTSPSDQQEPCVFTTPQLQMTFSLPLGNRQWGAMNLQFPWCYSVNSI